MDTAKKIKILLIDNDEMMRIYFRDIFWIHGRSDTYEVTMVYSLEEAEKRIINEDTRPNTIFFDVMMPIPGEDNSGEAKIKRAEAFIKKLKSDKDLSSIKIIIYSRQKEKFIKDRILKLGIEGYLVKGELMPKEIIDFTDKIHEPNN